MSKKQNLDHCDLFLHLYFVDANKELWVKVLCADPTKILYVGPFSFWNIFENL